MRKLINIDRVKMKALGYSSAPIRQILMLKLSSEEMIMLLNYFSHKHNWDIGNIGISERNFYVEKNKKRVTEITNKLKKMGYLTETDTHYIVELENIQKDYEHNLKEVETRIAIKQRERAKTRKQKVNVSGVTQNNPSNEVEQMLNIMLTGVTQSNYKGVTQSNYNGVTQNNPNNNNNNTGGAHAVSAPTTSNKPTNDDRLDVGDCVPSAPSSPSVTPQTTHTPTVDKKNDDNLICHTSINNEVNNNTPINDLQFLINNNIQFKNLYESNTAYSTANWYACDISKLTNDYIAYAVSERLKDTPIKDIPSNTYALLHYMVKYSRKTPNSKLWQAFLKETNNNTKLIDLIK